MMTPDNGRRLRLALATVWLADAALQYQPFMFTKASPRQNDLTPGLDM
jgi:hypothetical protein